MSTTKEASERSMEARLGDAGRRIDGIVAKAMHAQDNGKERVGRRVDSLRAREAWTRTRLRELRAADQAAWDAYVAELDRELDELEEVRVAGGSFVEVAGPVRNQGLRLRFPGGSRVTADLGLDRADTTVSGGSHLQLTGAAERLEADATGGSDLELTGLSLQHLTVRLAGASHAKVQADQTIAARASGASSLTYHGTPRFIKRDTSANSTIRSA
jgi:Putative auto-transporter adhesin, head GIN domain